MSNAPRGIFISFEGTEGSGKSTLIRNLAQLLDSKGFSTVQTREPGGNGLAEQIRTILLSTAMDPRTELFLYEAARAEHLAKSILPALKSGAIVLCDRFTDSTLAYQAYARGLPWKEVKSLNRIATGGLRPHLTVLLDLDPAIGLSRVRDPNRFEAEGLEFHKKVRKGFLEAKAEDPKRWLVLNPAKKSADQIAEATLHALLKKFKKQLSRIKSG